MIYLEISKFWVDMFFLLELVNEEKDKNNELEAQNIMFAAIEEKTLEEDELWGILPNPSKPLMEFSGRNFYK